MGTVRLSEVELSAEDDIGTVRVAAIGVEVDAPESTAVFRVSGVALETDSGVEGVFRIATVTVETGEIPDQQPAWFWVGGPSKWRARLAYSGVSGAWT